MARHKKLEMVEDEDPKLDISSLIDVCFLLLIYFLVATSLIQAGHVHAGTIRERYRLPD